MGLHRDVVTSLPALLQSTEKLLFWPTKALLRPGPRLSTLLASESPSLGMALCVKLLLEARTAGSNVRVDVSLALVTFTSRVPETETEEDRGARGRKRNQFIFEFFQWCFKMFLKSRRKIKICMKIVSEKVKTCLCFSFCY